MVIAAVNAFELGAQSVDPDITTNVVFIGSWSDAGLQTNSVNSMISQNVDVIAQFQDSTKTIIELCEKIIFTPLVFMSMKRIWLRMSGLQVRLMTGLYM